MSLLGGFFFWVGGVITLVLKPKSLKASSRKFSCYEAEASDLDNTKHGLDSEFKEIFVLLS